MCYTHFVVLMSLTAQQFLCIFMNLTLEYYLKFASNLYLCRRMHYIISFDALNNRNPRLCSHYVISREGVMQCNVIACLCFSLFLNAKLMFALIFTFSINMFSSLFSLETFNF